MGNAQISFQDDLLVSARGYDFDQESGVWTAYQHAPIADEEKHLAEKLRAARDRSTWSPEVAQLWRTTPVGERLGFGQHLPLTPMSFQGVGSVVCCGVRLGGLARWLGESGITVSVVTENYSEAVLTSARCQDLPRVRVMAGPIKDFESSEAPELGILNLAGAGLGEAQIQHLLAEMSQCLSSTSTLIVLTDNPAHALWSGRAVESATNESSVPGFDVWSDLVKGAGFPHLEWWACYPTPCMPLSLVQERAFSGNAELVRGLVRYGLSHSLAGLQPLPQEFSPLVQRGVGMRVAPGWMAIAHKHRVHRILNRGEIAHRFVFDASNCDVTREDWRSGVEATQPSARVSIASPERQVVLSWSEAFPTFRTANVVRHELGRVLQELARTRELLRGRMADHEKRVNALEQTIDESKKVNVMLTNRIELLVRSEERTIRLLSSAKEEIHYLEGQCERLEKRRDELMELTAAMSSSIRILSQPKYEPSLVARFKRAASTVWSGMY